MNTRNPFELGRSHAAAGQKSANPFELFSDKWALYNKGYNLTAYPEYFQ